MRVVALGEADLEDVCPAVVAQVRRDHLTDGTRVRPRAADHGPWTTFVPTARVAPAAGYSERTADDQLVLDAAEDEDQVRDANLLVVRQAVGGRSRGCR